MKKIIMLFSLVFSIGSLQAQEEGTISLNAYGGYTFDEKIPFDLADVKVAGGFQYGAGLEYYLDPHASVELKYNRLDSHFSSNGIINGNSLPDIKSSLNFILLGGNYYRIESKSQKAIPFVGAAFGLGIIDGPDIESSSHFSWDIRAGVKVKTGGPVSVKLQTYLQSMISTYGGDYYWTYWGPIYATNYKRILQFGLGAVISFDLNNRHSDE